MTYPPPAGGPAPWGPYPGGYGPPPGYRPAGTNGMAVASLVLGILGFFVVLIGPIVGLVLGLVALSQIKRTGQNGRGLAIAGVALSAVWLALFAALIATGVVAGIVGANDPAGRPQPYTSLDAGDCVTAPADSTIVKTVPVMAYTFPHTGEVYATLELPRGPFPGDEGLQAQGQQECFARFPGYAPTASRDPQVSTTIIVPSSGDWARGDRDVICIAETDAPRTGSIRGR